MGILKLYGYKCSRYSNHGKSACSTHYIDEAQIESVILSDIRHYAPLAAERSKLVEWLMASADAGLNSDFKKYQTEINAAEKNLKLLDNKIRRLFEERISGSISAGIFTSLMTGYDRERETLEESTIRLKKELAIYRTKTGDASKWVALIEKNIDLDSLDRETVFELIESVYVSESFKADGKLHQAIQVKYKFIGCLNTERLSGTRDKQTAKLDKEKA